MGVVKATQVISGSPILNHLCMYIWKNTSRNTEEEKVSHVKIKNNSMPIMGHHGWQVNSKCHEEKTVSV